MKISFLERKIDPNLLIQEFNQVRNTDSYDDWCIKRFFPRGVKCYPPRDTDFLREIIFIEQKKMSEKLNITVNELFNNGKSISEIIDFVELSYREKAFEIFIRFINMHERLQRENLYRRVLYQSIRDDILRDSIKRIEYSDYIFYNDNILRRQIWPDGNRLWTFWEWAENLDVNKKNDLFEGLNLNAIGFDYTKEINFFEEHNNLTNELDNQRLIYSVENSNIRNEDPWIFDESFLSFVKAMIYGPENIELLQENTNIINRTNYTESWSNHLYEHLTEIISNIWHAIF